MSKLNIKAIKQHTFNCNENYYETSIILDYRCALLINLIQKDGKSIQDYYN